MRSPEFYQQRLALVSRSFALCIPQLQPPFRELVAHAYLLMRVLDTVEDAPYADKPLQQRQFERLRGFLRALPARAEIDAFVAAFPTDLSAGERALLDDTYALLEDGHALAPDERAAIFGTVDRMALGMAAYQSRPQPLRLVDTEDVTRYCCFVAGIVGEMLTHLWALHHTEPAPPMRLAYHFGLFLQKVNILKDRQEDEAAGRFLVPDRDDLVASVRDHALGALEYIQALPPSDRGYRTFCAWCLMLGAVTLDQRDALAHGPLPSRRVETAELLARTAAIASDNAALRRQFAELMPRLARVTRRPPLAKPESAEWFRATLAAPLSVGELAALGLASARPSALAG
ncbi:MAG TPA: squalene/phytoene synthase family protein [Kofleriaceae bacterium]|jgi:phytoene/squalene synthetase|nr:squalene/phytoene synthase family protein [Kofleriaceae bacterium]